MKTSPSPNQLDLFTDNSGTILVGAAVDALLVRDVAAATRNVRELIRLMPDYPDLSKLQGLCEVLASWPGPVGNPGEIDEARRWLLSVVKPAAEAVMVRDTASFMQGLWADLAVAAREHDFDPSFPLAHAAYLSLLAGDTAGALPLADAVPEGHLHPDVLAWQAECRVRLHGPDAGMSAVFRLALFAPERFPTLVKQLGNERLSRAWLAYLGEDLAQSQEPSAEWFPSWYVLDNSDQAWRQPDQPLPTSPATQALAIVIEILALERRGLSGALIEARQRLQALDDRLFAHYMALRGRS